MTEADSGYGTCISPKDRLTKTITKQKPMKTQQLIAIAVASVATLALAACDVRQTEQGEMPDVDVDVKRGKLPKYDVDAGDIDVGTKKEKVEVTVPTVDVDTPAEDEAEDGGE